MHGILQSFGKVGNVALVDLYSLLCAFQFYIDLLQVFSLDQRRLRRVSVDPHAVRFGFFARFGHVGLLSLFRFGSPSRWPLGRLSSVGVAAYKRQLLGTPDRCVFATQG